MVKKPSYRLDDKKGGVYNKSPIHGDIEFFETVKSTTQKKKADGEVPIKSVKIGGK